MRHVKQGIVVLDERGRVLRSYRGVSWHSKFMSRVFLFLRRLWPGYR